jgi:hypothetical protein
MIGDMHGACHTGWFLIALDRARSIEQHDYDLAFTEKIRERQRLRLLVWGVFIY